MNFQLLRNSFVVGSLGVSFGGFIALFSPYNQISQFLVASGLGSLAGSSLAIQKCSNISNKKRSKLLGEINSLKAETSQFADMLVQKHKLILEAQDLASKDKELIKSLSEKNDRLNGDLKAISDDLISNKEVNFSAAIETLRESLEESKNQVSSLVPYLSKKFAINASSLLIVFDDSCNRLNNQIGILSDNNKLSSEEMIAVCLSVQHSILNKGLSIKAKLYKSALDSLQKQFNNLIPIEIHEERIKQLRSDYLGNIKSIHEEFNQVADTVITTYKSDFNEVVEDGLSQSKELESMQLELISLNSKLKELSKPLLFVGTSEPARVGNSIINYYHEKMGTTLDAIDFNSTETGYKLLFHLSRNNRFIPCDQLNDGNNPDKIKELSGSLNIPNFIQSDRSNYVSLDVELKRLEKKQLSLEDIRRLIEPANKFGDVVTRYHSEKPTLRVMTRTGGGKGIAVKNLLKHYLESWDGWEFWLSDPQHGSSEDYWQCAKVATSPAQANNILEAFADEFDRRKQNLSNFPDLPIMGIFDECDKTFDKKQKAGISQIWTEIRHRKMKLILIGQSGEVGKQGWQWDEMNNCVLIFIGDAIATAIKHSDDLGWSADMKQKIPSIYSKVSDFFQAINADIPIKNHHRFCLLISGLKYDFVEIPPALDGELINNKSFLASYPYESIAAKENKDLICPKCGSFDVKKNGRTGEKQRYKCSHCSHNFSY